MRPIRTAVCLGLVIACLPALAANFAAGQVHPFGPMPLYGPPAPEFPAGPTVQVTLSKPFYHIRIDPKTGAPQMPTDVVATARALEWPAGISRPTAFTWRVTLEW